MSIVKMKRLKIIAMTADRPALFEGLMRLETVEITEATENLKTQEWADIVERDESAVSGIKAQIAAIDAALDTLNIHIHEKKSIFAPRPTISFDEMFNTETIPAALDIAGEINGYSKDFKDTFTEESRLNNSRLSFLPWINLELPLNISSTRETSVIPGVCPSQVSFEGLKAALEKNAPLSEAFLIGSDREHHYILFVCHKSDFEAAMEVLQHSGFSRTVFKDVNETAAQHIKDLEEKIEKVISEREFFRKEIVWYADHRESLKRTADRLRLMLTAEQARDSLLITGEAFFLEGWTIASETERLKKLLDKYDCCYELTDPNENDKVPIKLQNTKMVEPFNMVTEMYGLPKYTNIDPNPLIAPFFAIFFGIMYGDVGYGLILIAAGFIVTAKLKPRGAIGQMFRLMKICGVTTVIFGVVYGSFFGDAIESVGKTFFGMPETFELKFSVGGVTVYGMIDLLADPITALIIALVIGAFHILTGMGIKAYLLIRDGRPLDALMDIGSWWVTFAGIGLFAAGRGPVLIYCGVAALILTQGRRSKNIGGKVIGGLGSLYSIVQYLSDVLSYSRLMALALASSVIAMVFNILASLVGSASVPGVILFALVFLFGHVFNIGVNLISTYVHGARLQYLEYFNRFYEGGGTAFKPFAVKPLFADIIKEE